ncbi:DUF433 domain-containing protein [Paucibacter sp. B2R-40]|uniref:DUF433 domain-containing protein n=1 Tax=Paucibacter sp. B2R-40 TaxID=2893554 RepID=UPI0021E43E00|nr:DUF433 domain-containing protein [Paucibacter sp. B2R-40]MCV2355344.1 DUF433 domain-containing protein [Paucibacter sp. B2R-40]
MAPPVPPFFVDIDDDGVPVFKGTRVPLDVVAASLAAGISFERVRASYPFLTAELAMAAVVYMHENPESPRRPGIAETHPDWTISRKYDLRGGLK